MHSVDWDGLQVFLAVARAGRMSAAARRLQVEHTTVSRRLAALESELGVPLFYRTTKGYLLTPHGENVLSNAEAMEREAVAVAARAREGSGSVAGLVRLAVQVEDAARREGGRGGSGGLEPPFAVEEFDRSLPQQVAHQARQRPQRPPRAQAGLWIARNTCWRGHQANP